MMRTRNLFVITEILIVRIASFIYLFIYSRRYSYFHYKIHQLFRLISQRHDVHNKYDALSRQILLKM